MFAMVFSALFVILAVIVVLTIGLAEISAKIDRRRFRKTFGCNPYPGPQGHTVTTESSIQLLVVEELLRLQKESQEMDRAGEELAVEIAKGKADTPLEIIQKIALIQNKKRLARLAMEARRKFVTAGKVADENGFHDEVDQFGGTAVFYSYYESRC